MVFSSVVFLFYFLPIALLIYYFAPKCLRNTVILISGVFFYAWGEPVYVAIMLLSILIDYSCGLLLDKYRDNKKLKRLLLILSLVMNLGLLAVFKYSSFFVDNINFLFGLSIQNPKIPLPIGISFYTFQSMSYTIDLYMDKIKVQKNFISFGAFVTMFPQIVAGPIVRYADVENEIDQRKLSVSMLKDGIVQFILGLSKKLLIANNIGALWAVIKASELSELSVATAWIGILAFTFQIYFDFSGYSDMAVGMGKMLGFTFPENFNIPYIAKSISEFWRRWHMTLGNWFKSYVYFPLGGNRGSEFNTIRNLLIVWMLTGFWHGASWNFVLWGLYFGVLIILEKLFLGKILQKLPAFLGVIYQFFLVIIGWVLFEFDNMGKLWIYLKAMFGGNGVGVFDDNTAYYLLSYGIIFLVCIIFAFDLVGSSYRHLKFSQKKRHKIMTNLKPIIYIVLFIVCIAYLVDSTYNPFLYFRF